MAERDLTVFQRIRDAALREKGVSLDEDEVRALYSDSGEVRQKAHRDDLRALPGSEEEEEETTH